jgi:hypothetical protein
LSYAMTGVLRRGGRALRSVGPGTVAVAAVALVIGGAGVADAATGGNFLLGNTNTETSTSVLTDTTGIPLSLNAVAGKQPFSVNSTVQVNRLNAQYVGGESAAQLQSTGGIGITSVEADVALPIGVDTAVASTGPLPAGTYYVSATATLWSGGSNVWCDVTSGPLNSGGGSGAGFIQAAETGLVTVPVNGIVSEACEGTAADQDEANAGVMAIRINSSSLGTTSPCARTPTRLPRDRSDC